MLVAADPTSSPRRPHLFTALARGSLMTPRSHDPSNTPRSPQFVPMINGVGEAANMVRWGCVLGRGNLKYSLTR